MPLVIIVGVPCSGKTTRSLELKAFLEKNGPCGVTIVGDETENIDKNEVYSGRRPHYRSLGIALLYMTNCVTNIKYNTPVVASIYVDLWCSVLSRSHLYR